MPLNPTSTALVAAAVLGLAGTAVAFAPTGTVTESVTAPEPSCDYRIGSSDDGETRACWDVIECEIEPGLLAYFADAPSLDLEPCTFRFTLLEPGSRTYLSSFAGAEYELVETATKYSLVLPEEHHLCEELGQL